MNIGYVGLGNMGGALAARLQLRYPLHVFDSNATAVQKMADQGAETCESLAELAARCEVILLCLPTSHHVKDAIFGPDGLAQNLARGTLLIDQSSGDPRMTRTMATELAARGAELVDAPVSGGPDGALAGTIAIMVGAGSEQYARVAPLLGAISPNLFHAGGSGCGHVMKLVNNMLSGAQRLLALEALSLASKNGIDVAMASKVLVAGGARNAYLETVAKNGLRKVNFSLGLMHKDMRLACDLGSESRVPLPFGGLAREFYQMCINAYGIEGGVQTAALLIDQLAGTQLVPPDVDLGMARPPI